MRVAALYDIHANLPALEAVVEEVREAKADAIVIGGDVLPGPMPRETIDYLLKLDFPLHFIRGNGDREVLANMRGIETGTVPAKFRDVMQWVSQQLAPEHDAVLASWPETIRLPISGVGEVLFCHATPRNDMDIFTRLTAEERLLPIFKGLDVSTVVCGHTHMQFDRMIGQTRVINAGSVGMPWGKPGADWLLLGPGVDLRHTSYDLEEAAERISNSGYPEAQDFAANNLLQVPSEEKQLEAFSRAELR